MIRIIEDITKKKCNKYIRKNAINILNEINILEIKFRAQFHLLQSFFWCSTMVDLNWKKVNTIHKYCINNKVKEVSFKIWHQIYPVKDNLR